MPIFKKRTQEIEEMFLGKNVILMSKGANFFGQQSKGAAKQIRGNGVLILTDKELYRESQVVPWQIRFQKTFKSDI